MLEMKAQEKSLMDRKGITVPLDRDLTHRHGGNGWAIVENLGDEMVRVCAVTPAGRAKRAFLAWQKLLTPTKVHESPLIEKPFDAETLGWITQLQNDLASGTNKVVASHIQ